MGESASPASSSTPVPTSALAVGCGQPPDEHADDQERDRDHHQPSLRGGRAPPVIVVRGVPRIGSWVLAGSERGIDLTSRSRRHRRPMALPRTRILGPRQDQKRGIDLTSRSRRLRLRHPWMHRVLSGRRDVSRGDDSERVSAVHPSSALGTSETPSAPACISRKRSQRAVAIARASEDQPRLQPILEVAVHPGVPVDPVDQDAELAPFCTAVTVAPSSGVTVHLADDRRWCRPSPVRRSSSRRREPPWSTRSWRASR